MRGRYYAGAIMLVGFIVGFMLSLAFAVCLIKR